MERIVYATIGVFCAVASATFCGCKLLKQEFPSQDVLACKAAVVAPYVGGIATSLAAQAEGKSINLISVLLGLDVSPVKVLEAIDAWKKCGVTNAIDEEAVKQLRMRVAQQ